jgi:hypothetical protein
MVARALLALAMQPELRPVNGSKCRYFCRYVRFQHHLNPQNNKGCGVEM